MNCVSHANLGGTPFEGGLGSRESAMLMCDGASAQGGFSFQNVTDRFSFIRTGPKRPRVRNADIYQQFLQSGIFSGGATVRDTLAFKHYLLDFSTFLGDYIAEYLSSEITLSNAIRDDSNGDEIFIISDMVYRVDYYWKSGPCYRARRG